jgi:hypothetical protein
VEEASRISSMADEVSHRMAKSFLSPKTLLSKMSVVDSPSKTATVYQDPNYLPFYFHLGRVASPRSVLCVGLDLGLQIGCLLQGCGDPKGALCVQPSSGGFYSPRMALSNIRSTVGRRFPVSVHVGDVGDGALRVDLDKKFDMAMIVAPMPVDSMMNSMDLCWSALNYDGTLVVDLLEGSKAGLIFGDFCKARGLEFRVLKTRYGTGIAGR